MIFFKLYHLLSSLTLSLHFRNTVYDSSMGGCLNALHSSCADDVVKLTAAELVGVFHQSICRTKSQELKVNYNKFPILKT